MYWKLGYTLIKRLSVGTAFSIRKLSADVASIAGQTGLGGARVHPRAQHAQPDQEHRREPAGGAEPQQAPHRALCR